MKRLTMILALAALAGCHKDPAPITPNQFFAERADSECAAIAAACLMPEATCTAGRRAQLASEYQIAIGEGRVFVPANAEACLAKVSEVYGRLNQGALALPGSEYQSMQTICANVYRGAAAATEACTSDLTCSDGLICDQKSGLGYCGVAKVVAAGAGCANLGEYCAAGSYCSNANASGFWLCTPSVTAQGYCTDGIPCLESLRCSANVCVARLGIGEPCAGDGDCTSGFCEPYALRCANDIRFANGTAACIAMGGT